MSVRSPAETGRPLRHLGHRLDNSRQIDGEHAVGIEIGEPEHAVAPAGRFRERQSV